LLNGYEQDGTVYLSWTPYRDFPEGTQEYIITRIMEGEMPGDVGFVGPGSTSFTEDISTMINGPQPGELYYQVKARSALNSENNFVDSHSNMISIPLTTELLMPNAFTPNNDGKNDHFGPVIDFAPKSFLMIIYDRSGQKLYETTDPYKGWDGTFKGGEKVMEGVYVYHVQYTGYNGITRSSTGSVAVIYPKQ
jgi:gliding motility-associated-like protein